MRKAGSDTSSALTGSKSQRERRETLIPFPLESFELSFVRCVGISRVCAFGRVRFEFRVKPLKCGFLRSHRCRCKLQACLITALVGEEEKKTILKPFEAKILFFKKSVGVPNYEL